MKHTTLHMIGNAHLDPVWLWRWQEGFQAAKATFRSALDRLAESPDFLFTSSSAAVYEWIEHNDPAMFEEIRARVAEGRWEIAGGWWIQPDCNLPCGESFVRQALLGQRYFQEKLGVMARVGYNVDSFGHHAMLPQILKKSGLDYYVMMRPGPHEKGLPGHLFWWEADDGSRVLTFRILYEYTTWGAELDPHVRRCALELKPPFDTLMCFYGVGNHGGGPTIENLASIRRLNQDPALPALQFSTPRRFFDEVLARDLPFTQSGYPVVHDELQHHASGSYSAHSGVKRWNRQAENLLLTAERLASVAARVTGQPYPTDFGRAWKNVLFNQFHDILAGACLPAAYEDARNDYGETIAIAGRALNNAVQSLAWNIAVEPQEDMTPIVVFNPHDWPAKVEVELDVSSLREGDVLLDDTGAEVAFQTLRRPVLVSGWRRRLCFVADLPPLGYRVYRLLPGASRLEVAPIVSDDTSMENDFFRLLLDPETGTIASLFDKRHGVDVLAGPGARAVVIDDPSDTWSHHNVFRFHDVVGSFGGARLRRIEHGPVKSTIRVESAFGASRLVQEISMYRELPQIEVRVTVDWHEQHKLLKLQFPVAVNWQRPTYEIPYGFTYRSFNGDEEPGQSWVDVSGVTIEGGIPYGLSLLNDGKYSFDFDERVLSMTVLRSPIYAHQIPAQPEPGEIYEYIDQGMQQFTYTLLPHSASWEQAGTLRRAAELNRRPIALVESFHPGPLPQHGSFLAIDPPNIVVGALKQAEDGDDLIVRCFETTRVATRATIHLPAWQRTIETEFGPCEIKTFRVPRDAARPVVETDLLERPLAADDRASPT